MEKTDASEKYEQHTLPSSSQNQNSTLLQENEKVTEGNRQRLSSISKQKQVNSENEGRLHEKNNNSSPAMTSKKANGALSGQSKDALCESNSETNANGKPDSTLSSNKAEMSTKPTEGNLRARECYKVFMLMISKLMFAVHLLLTIWRLTVLFGDLFWIISVGILAFLIDIVFVVAVRNGKEWTWFQPVVLIYLLLELPCIWLMELYKVSTVQEQNNQSVILGDLFESAGMDNLLDIGFSNETWITILEQSMLIFIIIARWMMPKGDLNRDQLSALLLMYIGTASDVVDFLAILSENTTLLLDLAFVFTILATWSWSLFQFMFVTSMTHSRSDSDEEENQIIKLISEDSDSDHVDLEEDGPPHRKSQWMVGLRVVVESEVWSIAVSLFMQDGPFVVVRLLAIFYWKITTYTNYFFTAKNALVLSLQIYRLIAVYSEHQKFIQEEKEKKKRTMIKLFNFFKRSKNRRKTNNSVSPQDSDAGMVEKKDESISTVKTPSSVFLT